jgi:CBS domain-containing protein
MVAVASTVHRNREDFAGRPIADAITTRGKELSPADTVETARRLFESPSTHAVPVLDGEDYLGALDRDSIGNDVPATAAVASFATAAVPTALAATPAAEALEALDRNGARRLVVLGDDGATFVGLVCMRGDRVRLCVDAARSPG